MSSNLMIVLGLVLIVLGAAVLGVTQILLHKWIKRFNLEWGRKDEMSKL